ncbi:hypothetical protein GGTG_08677 [Gaeumannomyces tritici R3-111a-1]|uniref:AAA+ ATPase lid domain-containing protein n=1 Tax=Gaeumannomyces tritici (strain R3-111a-1) TaxID=644352 RepID=J3P588_GAET3|nr:hypothetical protein GGTG_08677 [Gaeumannomyces tritici R3-111a-1]EJT74839.1 hypothetical protein GGTG_08677 [Gaeumannomyces tritici R3-111a-1]
MVRYLLFPYWLWVPWPWRLVVEQGPVIGFITKYWVGNPGGGWNGRQIRNACQTAIALAEYEARGSHDMIDAAEDKALGADESAT